MGRSGGRKKKETSQTPEKKSGLQSGRKQTLSNDMVDVNKPDEDKIKGAKNKKRTITNRTEAVFSEDEQEFVMEVEVKGQDTDFSNELDHNHDIDQEEGDMVSVAMSEIISFKQNKRITSSNNNATKEQREVLSEGQISSDEEYLEKSISR